MICKNCGQELTPGMKFCTGCGTSVEEQEPVTVETPVEKTVSTEPVQTPIENVENLESVKNLTGTEPTQNPEAPVQNFGAPVQNPGTPVQPMASQGTPVPPVFSAPNQYYNPAPQNNVNYNNAARPVYTAPAEKKCDDKPLSAWAYFGLMLLFSCTCCVGWIFMFVFAFSNEGNIHRKKFAQGYLIAWIIGLVLAIATIVFYFIYGAYILSMIDYNNINWNINWLNNPFGDLVSMFIH